MGGARSERHAPVDIGGKDLKYVTHKFDVRCLIPKVTINGLCTGCCNESRLGQPSDQLIPVSVEGPEETQRELLSAGRDLIYFARRGFEPSSGAEVRKEESRRLVAVEGQPRCA